LFSLKVSFVGRFSFEQQKHEIEIKLIDCGKPNHSFKIGQESLIPLSKFGFGVKVEKCEIFSQIR
jgi:hypothetical protein